MLLLRNRFHPPAHSELAYLVGVRHKLLAHPRRNAFIKNSRSALTIGPILHVHLVGGDTWVPRLRNSYLQQLKKEGGWLSDEDGMAANEALLRSDTTVEDFTLVDRLRLKCYLIREANLIQSATELASLLQAKFLPDIRGACTAVRPKHRR